MKIGLLGLGIALSCSVSSAATVLTFDISPLGDEQGVPLEYGDNVTGPSQSFGGYTFNYDNTGDNQYTPNVTFDYQSSGAFYTNGYSGLTNVHYLDDITAGPIGDGPQEDLSVYIFDAAPGYSVELRSFDLSGYEGGFTIPTIAVTDGVNTLLTLNNVSGGGATTVPINVTSPGGGALYLRIDAAGGTSNGFAAIDNIVFSQTAVPEPATLGVLAAGVVVMGRRRF